MVNISYKRFLLVMSILFAFYLLKLLATSEEYKSASKPVTGTWNTNISCPECGEVPSRQNLSSSPNGSRFGEITVWQNQLHQQSNLAPVLGHKMKNRSFLTIGISTVYRKQQYLQLTLKSLIAESDPQERTDTVIVIYLADTDKEKKKHQLKLIERDFLIHLNSGFMQVIQSGPEIYPSFDFVLTKRTFGDPIDRVLWRAKQVIDFVFLFTYTRKLSDYYLLLEDDVISSTGYITAIKDVIESSGTSKWIALEFTELTCIGLLFRNNELDDINKLLIMFYKEFPVDLLIRKYISLRDPDGNEGARRSKSLFQHIGLNSTLQNKESKIEDKSFNWSKRRLTNHSINWT